MTKLESIMDKTEIHLETKLYTSSQFLVISKNTFYVVYLCSFYSLNSSYWETSHKLSDWPKLHCTVQLQISNSNAGFINKYNVFTCLSPACMQLAAMPMPYPAGHSVCTILCSSLISLLCTVAVQLYCAATTPRLAKCRLAQTEVVKQLLTISEDENFGDSHEFIV